MSGLRTLLVAFQRKGFSKRQIQNEKERVSILLQMRKGSVFGVDLFCGAGGLAFGLQRAGISIAAGIDLDPVSEFPFTANCRAQFIRCDVRDLRESDLS